jgi:hypothetical protein
MNLKLALVAASLALASSGASAAIQSVSVSGATVDFSFQYDDSLPNRFNLGVFQVSGDSLSFSPTNFFAEQNGLTGWNTANATTPLITVTAKAGYILNQLSLFEQGDYYRIQTGSGMTTVKVGGEFIVNNVATAISTAPLTNAMSAQGLFDDTETFQTSSWSYSTSVALNAVESATAKVQNILKAGVYLNATPLDVAFIEKKLMVISAQAAPVPVPGAVWLFGTALAGFFVSRRNNQQA